MTKTLLEKALSIKPAKKKSAISTDEFIELSIAWLKGEVDNKALHKAMGYKEASYNKLYRVAIALKTAYEKGLIKVV